MKEGTAHHWDINPRVTNETVLKQFISIQINRYLLLKQLDSPAFDVNTITKFVRHDL